MKIKNLLVGLLAVVSVLVLTVSAMTACGSAEKMTLVCPDGAPLAAIAEMWGEDFDNADLDYTVTGEADLKNQFAKGTEFIVAPTNIGANIHNSFLKGGTPYDYKLMNVTSWGVLYLITTDTEYEPYDSSINNPESVKSYLSRFSGTITTIGLQAIPGRTATYLFDEAGAKVKIEGSDATTIQQSVAKKDNITAIIGEPAITAMKSKMDFKVLASITVLYNGLTGEDFPMAGMFVRADIADKNPALIENINNRVKQSVEAFNADPETVGNNAEKNIEGTTLKGAILKAAQPNMNVGYKTGKDSKSAVDALLSKMNVTVGEEFYL